ncbi:replication initiator protein A, partial [Enterococcus faecium]|nr:replication initiator protein A [Enterococcus faecium]MCH3262687.1 replication initiator protein A [Enterococcus faecium]
MSTENQSQKMIIKNWGYKATNVYIEKYYKFPSFLIQNSKYSKMKDSSKIAYMLFKNEFRRALHEKWIDDDGLLYLEFTQADLMDKLNCYQGKVKTILNELETYNLISVVKGEFNPKTKKNEKNKYYLLQPEISADDLFIQNSFDDDLSETIDKSTSSRNAEIARREETAKTLDNTGNAEIAQDYYINKSLDTKRHLKDTETDQLQNQVLLDNFVEIMKEDSINTFVPEKVLSLIKTFSNTYEEAQQTVTTIHKAKHKAEELEKTVVVYEELESYGIDADKGLYMTLLKAYQKQKTEKVNNLQNLIFVYVKNWFIEKAIAAKLANEQRETFNELPTVSTE